MPSPASLFHPYPVPKGCLAAAAAALLLLLCATASAQQPAPQGPADAPERSVWDLTPLYASEAAWEQDRQAALASIAQLAALRGSLGNSPQSLLAALDAVSASNRRLQRLWVYASTQLSTDNRAARNQERSGLMQALQGQMGSALAWMDPELQALGSSRLEAAITTEAGLAKHAVRLRNTLRQASHTLSPETEGALAALSPVLGAPSQIRSLLVEADAQWPQMTVDGRSVKVNANGYGQLRQHPDRAVRKQAFTAFFGALGGYENTFGAALGARVQSGAVQAKLRKHPSAVAASLHSYQMPESVYRMLVAQANAGLPTLHRYFKLRQRMLGLPDLQYHDIYPALVAQKRSYSGDEAAQLTLAATVPLGPEYQALLSQALAARSMHLRPAEGKSSGAYQTSVYGLTPFVFLNHRDDFQSVSTFAHEWGHGVHTMLAQRSQPFETAGYSLFLAEIASVTNEVLLSDHMLKQATTRDEKLFYLGHMLELLRASFFRQTMFGEFELMTHDAVERGEALSGKKMTTLYCGLLRKYHGADAGVMGIDPQVCQEWSFIPHFYRPFYVYQYATSMAAASYFGEQILSGQAGARDNYLKVLRAGGSLPPYELLKTAGLDMAGPAPYQAVMRRMDAIVDEMERLLATPK